MVVVPEPLAAEVALDIFREGGNAVDATVAASFAQGVVNPMLCGIGGCGSMLVHDATHNNTTAIEFSDRAGSGVHRKMWINDFLGQERPAGRFVVRDELNTRGYQSVVIPSFIKGVHVVWERYGSLPWARLLGPAIDYAINGFAIDDYTHSFWRRNDSAIRTLTTTDACAEIYTKSGRLYDLGETLIQKDLGMLLRRVAEEGPAPFYQGDIAASIAADFEANRGFITQEDLAQYQPLARRPVVTSYRGYTLVSDPPPGSGFQVAEMLKILEGFDLKAIGWNSPEFIRVLSEAVKIGFTDKVKYLGDPEFAPLPLERLLSDEYAYESRQRILRGEKVKVPMTPGTAKGGSGMQLPEDHEASGTTHVSALDAEGHAVSFCHSICSSSGVVTRGLGFMYNNSMGQFCPDPDAGPNPIEPNRLRGTGSCPVIVFQHGRPLMIVGSPGGNNIPTSVLQVMVNVLDFDMHIQEAVNAPRFHGEGGPIELEVTVPMETCRALEGMGYQVERSAHSYGGTFGRVQAIMVDPQTGRKVSGADPRGGGGVACWPLL